jgi:hypothetical protein
MFVETITSDREDWEFFSRGTRLTTDPPETLALSVAWDAGDDRVTVLNVWDSGESIADFYVERTRPLIEQRGEPADKPKRHGAPLEVYVRG